MVIPLCFAFGALPIFGIALAAVIIWSIILFVSRAR